MPSVTHRALTGGGISPLLTLLGLVALLLSACGGQAAVTVSGTGAGSPSTTAERSSAPNGAAGASVASTQTVASSASGAGNSAADSNGTGSSASRSSAVTGTVARASGPVQKVALVFPGPGTLIFLPFEVAKAQGYFTQQGVAVDFTYSKGGPPAVQALNAKSADFVGTTIDLALNSEQQGKTITMVTSLTRLPAFAVVTTNPKVTALNDLAGKKVGLTNIGAGDQLILRFLLKKQGVDPNSVQYVAVGPDEAKINALGANQIDAAILQEPALSIITAKGGHILANLYDPQQAQAAFGGGYQFTGLVTRPDVIKDRPELVQRMVNAVVAADVYIASHSGQEIAATLPDAAIVGGDRAGFAKILDQYKQAIFSPDGRIQPDQVQVVARVQQESGALTGNPPDMTQFFTDSFVDKVPR